MRVPGHRISCDHPRCAPASILFIPLDISHDQRIKNEGWIVVEGLYICPIHGGGYSEYFFKVKNGGLEITVKPAPYSSKANRLIKKLSEVRNGR